MRLLLLFFGFAASVVAQPPATLEAALKTFRAEGPAGWSFVQTSVAGRESLVERYDSSMPEFDRWSLVSKNGRPAHAEEQRDYREKQTRRSRGGHAPRITESLDLTTVETLADSPERTTYRCQLKRGDANDKTAAFLRATIVVHRPTATIESFELGSIGEFSPSAFVLIKEMKTTMTFTLPVAEKPSLLLSVVTRLRGRAFYFKSLDEDMKVTYSEHTKAVGKSTRPTKI